jgi:peptidylprolyl isomerase
MAAVAQTAAKPAPTTTKPSAPTAKSAPASTAGAAAAAVKYPSGKKAEPQIKKTLFALRVQDLKIGTGAEAEPLKMYKVKYTGWRAADGIVFDSWDQHPTPVMGADGKPEMGDDGKPKTTAPQPASFPVGMGRMIPGFDQGFAGMHVGGIRRIFIPWQLGYGSRSIPDRDKDHPGIPAKSDLVFEVELVDLTELPASPHPGMPGGTPPGAPGGAAPPHPSTPPPSGSAPSTPPPSSQPSTPPPSDKPSTPQSN